MQSIPVSQILNTITLDEIYTHLTQNRQFLTLIKMGTLSQLRTAIREKIQQEDEQARVIPDNNKINVLDLTMDQLIQHCWNKRQIGYIEFQNKPYTLHHHKLLSDKLTKNYPRQFYIGQKSAQYHHKTADFLNDLYGVGQNQVDENEGSQEEQSVGSFIVEDDQEPSVQQSQIIDQHWNEEKKVRVKTKMINKKNIKGEKKRLKKQVQSESQEQQNDQQQNQVNQENIMIKSSFVKKKNILYMDSDDQR